MRVVYVCADPGVPVFGSKGSSVRIQSILAALVSRGLAVELLATRAGGPRPKALASVRVHRLPAILPGEPARRERSAQAANDAVETVLRDLGPFDLLYERQSLWSFAALEHASRSGVPAVLEVNAPLIDEQERHRVLVDRAGAEAAADRQVACASLLVAVSQGVAEYLRARHPAVTDRIRVVGNGVDPERFPPEPARDRGVRERPFTVGFVGTLEPRHGLPILVDAVDQLRDRLPEAPELLVVGEGPDRRAFEAELAARGLLTADTFAGAVAPERVPALLGRMDATVAPYPDVTCYSSPLKVLESMAAGVPVVASRVGDIEALVTHRATGILVPPGDATAIAESLAELALRPVWRRRLGGAARRRVLAHHTWDRALGRILAAVSARESTAEPA